MYSYVYGLIFQSTQPVPQNPSADLPERYRVATIGLEALKEISPCSNIPLVETNIFFPFAQEIKLLKSIFCPHFGEFDSLEKKQIYDFCKILINRQKDSGVSINLPEIKTAIAKIIYLSDQDLNATSELLDHNSIPSSLEKISLSFQEKMEKINQGLAEIAAQNKIVALQDPEKVLEIQKPLAIANALITSTGVINIHLILSIKESLLGNQTKEWELDVAKALNQIAHSQNLQNEINTIEFNDKLDINSALKILLGYSSEQNLTRRDAVVAGLGTLLTHLRQGPMESCFTSSFGSEFLEERMGHSLSDFKQLIHYGNIKRLIKGKKKEIEPSWKFEDENLTKLVSIDRKGFKTGTEISLDKIPGIKVACLQMGIPNPEEHLTLVVNKIFKSYEGEDRAVNIRQILGAFASIKYESSENFMMMDGALCAFSSQTTPVLIRLRESCLEKIANKADPKLSTHHLYHSIEYGIKNLIEEKKVLHPQPTQTFLQLFKKVFEERAQYVYVSDENESHPKGFVLYDIEKHKETTSTKVISSAEEFKDFLVEIIKDVNCQFKASSATWKEHKVYRELALKTKECVTSELFLDRVLAKYAFNYQGQFDHQSLRDFQNNLFLPWMDRVGNDPQKVSHASIYQPSTSANVVTVKNSREFLKKIIGFSVRNKSSFMEINSGICSLTMKEKEPTLEILSRGSTSQQDSRINQRLVDLVAAISREAVEEETRNILIDFAEKNLVSTVNLFRAEAEQIDWKNMSVYDFYQKLLHLALKVGTDQDPKVLKLRLNNCLIRDALPQSAKYLLEKSLYTPFEPNWNDEENDINIGFMHNPGTRQVDLISVDSKGRITLMDQDKFFSLPWTFTKGSIKEMQKTTVRKKK